MTGREQGRPAEGPGGDDGTPDVILRAIGKQIKLLRERAGLTQAEFGLRIGYGEEQVSSVERGRRPPKPQFIEAAEEVLHAGGLLHALLPEIEQARYPARFRDFPRWEADAVQIHMYDTMLVPGPLQTEEYALAIYRMRRPPMDEETIEQHVAARMARRGIFDRRPAPVMSFVLEESVLRRPLGGREVLRGQLEHLLHIGRMRNVEIQVMPTERDEHAGLPGPLALLEPLERPKIAYTEGQGRSIWFTERVDVRAVEVRYGIIRAQALTPRESLELAEKLLGET